MHNAAFPTHVDGSMRIEGRPSGITPAQPTADSLAFSLASEKHHQLLDGSKLDDGDDMDYSNAGGLALTAGMTSHHYHHSPHQHERHRPSPPLSLCLSLAPRSSIIIPSFSSSLQTQPTQPPPPPQSPLTTTTSLCTWHEALNADSPSLFANSYSPLKKRRLLQPPAVTEQHFQEGALLIDTTTTMATTPLWADSFTNRDFTDGFRSTAVGGTGGSSSSSASNGSTEYLGSSSSYLNESGVTSASSSSSCSSSHQRGGVSGSSLHHRQKRYSGRPSLPSANPALSDSSSSSSSETSTRPSASITSSQSSETESIKDSRHYHRSSSLHSHAHQVASSLQQDLPPNPWQLHNQQQQLHPSGPLVNGVGQSAQGSPLFSSRLPPSATIPSTPYSPLASSICAVSPHALSSDSRTSSSTTTSTQGGSTPSTTADSGQDLNDFGEDPAIRRAEQNRAAQRAFRLRKQKYIKWLETKASELEEVFRIMAIVRAENQQLCNMVMDLRAQMHQATGGGTASTTHLGQGIEVIRVGDHYESTLGREVSMRLMNLGTFKGGHSESRPRYQPRNSAGSSSKRKSATSSIPISFDQQWNLQQQRQQPRAMQLSPPPPPSASIIHRDMDRMSLSSFANGSTVGNVNTQGDGTPTTISEPMTGMIVSVAPSTVMETVAPTAAIPSSHFDTLAELSCGQTPSVPITTWTNGAGARFTTEEQISSSPFSTTAAATQLARVAVPSVPHMDVAKAEPQPMELVPPPPSVQANPTILTSPFTLPMEDSPTLLARSIPTTLPVSAEISFKTHSVSTEMVVPMAAPLIFSSVGTTSFSGKGGVLSLAPTVGSPTKISHHMATDEMSSANASLAAASTIVPHVTSTAIGQPIANISPLVTRPAPPVVGTTGAHIPLNIALPSLVNSATTAAPVGATAAPVVAAAAANNTTAGATLQVGTGVSVMGPALVDTFQPQPAGPPLSLPTHSFARPMVPQSQPIQVVHGPVSAGALQHHHHHQHALIHALDNGLDPYSLEKGRRSSMPTMHLALPPSIVTALPPSPVPPMTVAPPSIAGIGGIVPIPASSVMGPHAREWNPMVS